MNVILIHWQTVKDSFQSIQKIDLSNITCFWICCLWVVNDESLRIKMTLFHINFYLTELIFQMIIEWTLVLEIWWYMIWKWKKSWIYEKHWMNHFILRINEMKVKCLLLVNKFYLRIDKIESHMIVIGDSILFKN